jgi:hypothetical protein
MAPPQPPTDTDVPRVLLFGHRGAGKSALIGALLKAGETQGETLRGEVVHSSVDLPRIRDAVYNGGKLDPQKAELVSYTVRLKPVQIGAQPVGEPLTVVLDDCDGKAAETLLEHPEPITQRAPDSPVARAVVGCDAIVLLVDAASTDEELAEAFEEFDTFLTVVGRAKTDARAVGGFPVFLVLTQCDRLVQPGDTRRLWEARVNDRTEYAWKAFDAYLKDADPEDGIPSPFLPFGSVDLSVVAAAVRRPPVPDAPAPGDLPYQVAELFRDCFAAARAHHERVRSSDVRLKWTVRLAAIALSAMFFGLALVALFPPHQSGPSLAERVGEYLAREPPAAVRLSEGEIERNKKVLLRFQTDIEYPGLDTDLRAFVDSRVKEIEDYQTYRGKLANAIVPASARNLPDLAAVRTALEGDLALPPEYAWGETAAAELRRKWLTDCNAIEAAVKAMIEKYRAYDRDGTAMTLRRGFDTGWLADLDALGARADQPPFPLDEPLPGSIAVNQPRGEVVTYRVPYEFDEVYHARRYWEQTRDRLGHLRDLSDALGATAAPNRPPAVLVLPEPDGTNSATLPNTRWTALLRTYPRQSDGYPEWEVRNFPDPARSDLAGRLKRSFETGVRHVHQLMRVQDTKEGWKALSATLNEPAYRDWGRLLHLLARLQDPSAPDPVAELATFLADLDTKTFDLDLPALDLVVPLDFTVGLDRVVPAGPLTVTLVQGQDAPVTIRFQVGPGETRDKTTVYRLTREGTGKLAYRAGADLRAELPVKAGAQAQTLRWEVGASNTFRFDRLTREPRITKATGTDPAPGVRLVPTIGCTLPKLPALVPVK